MTWLSDDSIDRLREAAAEPDLSGTRYKLVRALGRGGMATVYLARDRELDREVALKVLDLPDRTGDLASRMHREARIVARLEHPGIVPIHDVGTLPDDRVFYAMKHVNGERLDAFPRKSLPERLRVFEKICDAVAFAHSQGVIHRDLKPENVMVGEFGEVLVMDWGLAKALREPETAAQDEPVQRTGSPLQTDHGTVLGTPAYMAPEQASGDIARIDERTDVYALGAILYFLLTGEGPGSQETPASPRKLNEKIARSIEAVCLKAMAARQPGRYANARELAHDVARYLDGLPVSAYRENPLEMMQRWISRNYFVVILVLSYLVMRVLLILFRRP